MKPGDFLGLRVFCLTGNKEEPPMNNLLYVGNIPDGVTEEGIRELFSRLGRVVSMHFIKDQNSFQPKWFGFVEMASETEADEAMEALNGRMLLSRPLTVFKRNNRMAKSKPCSFCISKKTCNKPEAERQDNCRDYMLQIESEDEQQG